MIYKTCSMKSVIGRVIRNTRVQDTSYIVDMHDWIHEAMGMMQTKQTLTGKWQDCTVTFHKTKTPCGLQYIDAVEYNGCRLPMGNGVRPPERENVSQSDSGVSVFQTVVDKIQPVENHLIYTTKLNPILTQQVDYNHWYNIDIAGFITTSVCDGTITVYFRAIPSDDDGLPLIVDNENYKQALYWYARAQMIGAGYPDKQFSYEQCIQYHELYAGRAMAEITYPSPDEMESRVNTLVRFIPPQNYYENFFRTDRREPFIETQNW